MLTHPPERTLDEVRDCLAADERRLGREAAAVMARLFVKHGNVTDEARDYAARFLAASDPWRDAT